MRIRVYAALRTSCAASKSVTSTTCSTPSTILARLGGVHRQDGRFLWHGGLVLHTDEATSRWAAEDYGGLVHQRPAAVLRPSGVAEISAVLRENTLIVPRRGRLPRCCSRDSRCS